jgi:uroporphyrinogen-III synthase
MSDPRPLADCIVFLTRPDGESGAMDDALVAAGARVVRAPAIEFIDLIEQNMPQVRIILDEMRRQRGWLILPSPTAVHYYAELLSRLHLDGGALDGMRVATIGEAGAAALRAHGLPVDFTPPLARGESLAQHLPGPADVPALILGSRQTRAELREGLTRRGFRLQILPLYAPRPCPAGLDRLTEAFAAAANAADDLRLIVVTSPSGVDAIMERHADAATGGATRGWISIGPTTHRRLLQYGIAPANARQADQPRADAVTAAAARLAARLRGGRREP